MNFFLIFGYFAIYIFRKYPFDQSSISPQNQSQIHWFLISWIRLQVLFHKISLSPIFVIDSLSDLIKFEEIIKNFPNSLWIRHYLALYPSIRELFLKLVSLEFIWTRGHVFSTITRCHLVRRPTLTLAMQAIVVNKNLFLSTAHSLTGTQSRGRVKKNKLSLSPMPKLNTMVWCMLPLRCFGYVRFFRSLVF